MSHNLLEQNKNSPRGSMKTLVLYRPEEFSHLFQSPIFIAEILVTKYVPLVLRIFYSRGVFASSTTPPSHSTLAETTSKCPSHKHCTLDWPFVSRALSGKLHRPPLSAEPRNQALFDVSVLLIELCLGIPFVGLWEQYKQEAGIKDPCSNAEVANSLVDKISDDRGKPVLTCIQCRPRFRENSPKYERVREVFYRDVVVPLE